MFGFIRFGHVDWMVDTDDLPTLPPGPWCLPKPVGRGEPTGFVWSSLPLHREPPAVPRRAA